MRDILKLFARLVLGGYLVVHGAQKLFGAFGGSGIEKATAAFEKIGLKPPREMAIFGAATEVAGGVLTATGLADPLGPLMIAGSMAVASTAHRAQGPLAAKGGFELPVTNLALAGLLAATGPGRIALGRPLPKKLTIAAAIGGAALAGVSIAQILRAKRAPQPATPPPPPAPVQPEVPAEADAAARR
jgi:putative oxidoreductase